jgi:MtN3 and saliva related transmembrane protein
MAYVDILGFVAGTLTTIATIPQIIKALKTKHIKDVSFLTFLILDIGMFLWLIYGILIWSIPVIITNVISFILVFTMLMLKIKYK